MNKQLLWLLATLVLTAGATGIVIATYDGPAIEDASRFSPRPALIWQLRTQANTMIEARKFPEAARILQRLHKQNPGNTAVLRLLGRCAYENGNYHEALNLFHTLLVRKPDDPTLRNNLGQVLIRQRAFEAGIKELLAARALAPETAYIDYNLGKAYQLLGDSDKAAEYLAAAKRNRVELSVAPPDVITDSPVGANLPPEQPVEEKKNE